MSREEQQAHNMDNTTKSSQHYNSSLPSSSVWSHYQSNNQALSGSSDEHNPPNTYPGEIETRMSSEKNNSTTVHDKSPLVSPSSSSSLPEKTNFPPIAPNHAAASDNAFNQNLKNDDDEAPSQFDNRIMNPPALIATNGNSALLRRISQCSTASNSSSIHSPRYEGGELSDGSDVSKLNKGGNEKRTHIKNVMLPMHLAMKEDEISPSLEIEEEKGPNILDTPSIKEIMGHRTQAAPGKIDGKNKKISSISLHFSIITRQICITLDNIITT